MRVVSPGNETGLTDGTGRELVKCELDVYLVGGEIASSHVIIRPLLLVRFFSQCRRRHIFKKMFLFFYN